VVSKLSWWNCHGELSVKRRVGWWGGGLTYAAGVLWVCGWCVAGVPLFHPGDHHFCFVFKFFRPNHVNALLIPYRNITSAHQHANTSTHQHR
jgi:hypothetical protein